MRRVRKSISLGLLALLTLIVGCSQSKPKPVLGFSPIVSWGNWSGAAAASIRTAANNVGIEVRLEDARHSQERQVAALRSFVAQRVDVIAFSPVVETGWEA